MVRQLASEYPVSLLCEVLAVARSTVYYQPQAHSDDAELLAAIERLLMRWPFYGYRRVTAQLKREGWLVGETRVRRLLRQLDHSCSVGRVRVRTTDSDHDEPRFPNLVKDLDITRPNQVWVADITYLRLGRRFIYLAVILDAFTRGLRGWCLSHSLETEDLTKKALQMAQTVLSEELPEHAMRQLSSSRRRRLIADMQALLNTNPRNGERTND